MWGRRRGRSEGEKVEKYIELKKLQLNFQGDFSERFL